MELLAGLIGAVIGFASKAITDALTERRRREGEKRARLLEAEVRHGLNFMEAAARLARTRQSVSTANMSLDGAKGSGSEETYQFYRAQLMEARETAAAAFTEAEAAFAAIRLLMPKAAEDARGYLDLCNEANAYPDEKRAAREQARHDAEAAIRRALGA